MDSLLSKIGICSLFLCVGISCSGGSDESDVSSDPDNSSISLQQLSINPFVLTRTVGERYQFQAMGSYSDGSQNDLTDSVTWSIDDSDVASVDTFTSKGLVEFLSTGSTFLRAEHENHSAQ
ncbi:MAG: Ig-like domain-containing protein, partial [Candidatus Thiodiazotropha sp.]